MEVKSNDQLENISDIAAHPLDEIRLWLEVLGEGKSSKITIKTTLSELKNNQNILSFKEGIYKHLLLKVGQQL